MSSHCSWNLPGALLILSLTCVCVRPWNRLTLSMLSTPCICGPFAGASSKSPNVVLIARSWLNDDPIPPRAGEGIALNFGVSFVPSYSVGVSTRCVVSVKISAYFRACDMLQHATITSKRKFFLNKHFPQNSTTTVTQLGVSSPTNSSEGI